MSRTARNRPLDEQCSERMADVEQDADIKVTRSRLMAAIAAGNADALTEVCNSIASEWASELSSEVAAARKAIELVRGHEDAVKALEREKAAALQLKEQMADLGEQQRNTASEVGQADGVIADLKEQLSSAELRASGHAPASAAAELSAIQQENRINELQSVIVSLPEAGGAQGFFFRNFFVFLRQNTTPEN